MNGLVDQAEPALEGLLRRLNMNGLENQAEAALEGLLRQLYTEETAHVRNSSRDIVMSRVTEELKNQASFGEGKIVVKSLVMRNGISMGGLRMLQEALAVNDTIEALEFVGLRTLEELSGVIECCRRQPRIRHLTLKQYRFATTRLPRRGRESLASLLRNMIPSQFSETTGLEIPNLSTLILENFPMDSAGVELLADRVAQNSSLKTFKLINCGLRCDSALSIAQMIRMNKTLVNLDLSFNNHFFGSDITTSAASVTQEIVIKALVQRGLRYNLSLEELGRTLTYGGPIKHERQISQQLDITKFRKSFERDRQVTFSVPPSLWCYVLARIAPKPSAAYLFLQDLSVAIYR